jgi:hypothetical protein
MWKSTRWFKYDRDYLCVNKSQFVPLIFEPPCKHNSVHSMKAKSGGEASVSLDLGLRWGVVFKLRPLYPQKLNLLTFGVETEWAVGVLL